MSGRVQEHAEGRAGLVLVLGRPELEDGGLSGVEIVHDHVEVHLLGWVLRRPDGCRVAVHPLERRCSPRTPREHRIGGLAENQKSAFGTAGN